MEELTALFIRASKLWRGAVDEAMSRHGVRVGQNLILKALWRDDGLTPGELAERLGVSTPTVVKSAGRMVAAGLLDKRPDTADRRLVRLYLTPRARAVREAVLSAHAEVEARATATLTATERQYLRSALEKVIAQFEAAPSATRLSAGDPSRPRPDR